MRRCASVEASSIVSSTSPHRSSRKDRTVSISAWTLCETETPCLCPAIAFTLVSILSDKACTEPSVYLVDLDDIDPLISSAFKLFRMTIRSYREDIQFG